MNSPIPREELRRQPAPQVGPVSPEPNYVPGEAADLESVVFDGEAVEMAAGRPLTPGVAPGAQPSFPVSSPDEWPTVLTAQVRISPNAGGSPNQQALRAPAKTWLRIDEIRFSVRALKSDNPDVTFSTYTAMGFGAVIAANFTLDGKALTSGPVPVSVFGPSRKLTAERLIFNEPGGYIQSRAEEYVWPLEVPIFVKPGSILEPTFEHRGYLDYQIRVRVSYAGVLLKQAPSQADQSKLPFVSAWVAPTLPLDGTLRTAESTEKDLVGPPAGEFNVEYFIGRQYLAIQSATFKALMDADLDAGGFVAVGVIERSADLFWLKLAGSWGAPVVPEMVPHYAVFDRVSRQLQVPHIVPEDGYYIATVTNNAQDLSGQNVAGMTIISLVGWQEVSP
ncbi:MAG: hypothetical protein KJ648_07265 [Candidatus Omnitrophica bacterium]|nr:hypothetical protein [Candidatus Omnitrophota bacterium]